MGTVYPPQPVTLFIAVLYQDPEIFQDVLTPLTHKLGGIEWASEPLPFTYTCYYRSIGDALQRIFLVFQERIDPGNLPDIKLFTNQLEESTATRGKSRHINLDPGYFDGSKIVLATTKNFSHRVYLGKGIYGESTIRWEQGDFRPFHYTYPDYASPEYRPILWYIRELHRSALNDMTKQVTQ